MDYSDTFMRQHDEMCQVVGSIVFRLSKPGVAQRAKTSCSCCTDGLNVTLTSWKSIPGYTFSCEDEYPAPPLVIINNKCRSTIGFFWRHDIVSLNIPGDNRDSDIAGSSLLYRDQVLLRKINELGFFAGTAEISGQVISQKAVLSVYTFFPYSQ